MMSNAPSLSALVAIMGDYRRVYRHVARILQDISESKPLQMEVVLLVHGEAWLRALQFLPLTSSGVRVIVVPSVEELPAVLFNEGARRANGKYITFAWPGIDFSTWLPTVLRLAQATAEKPETILLAGPPPRATGQGFELRSWTLGTSGAAPPAFQGGWLEMLDYVPMESVVISRKYFLSRGGFSCCPVLQRGFWWEFTIRVSRSGEIDMLDVPPQPKQWSWWDLPLNCDLMLSGDLAARRAVRRTGIPTTIGVAADYDSVDSFARDLPSVARQRLRRQFEHWIPEGQVCPISPDTAAQTTNVSMPNAPLRVVVLGGLNEPAHNQLCFYNYFSQVEGQGIATWRGILDCSANYADLEKADLVIFSRTRTEWACRLMDYCVKQQIPTVYMLDDNWLSVANEWPEYASIFVPGAAPYENFMYCLTRADRVLTYSPVLAEDLRPYNPRIEELPTNIDLTLFCRPNRAVANRPRVGYAGSLRRENSAFAALLDLALERDDFDVFVMSASIPESLEVLPVDRLFYEPYVFGYRRYAQVLCDARPTVLLAPLSGTRTDASKCPNKYLEITAAGAVGVYSKTAPYDRFIRDRDNGLLVDNDAADWKSAISELLDDSQLRKSIFDAAECDVRTQFSTPAVLPRFLDFLARAAAGLQD